MKIVLEINCLLLSVVFGLIVPGLGDSHLVTPSPCPLARFFFVIWFLFFFLLLYVLFENFVLFQHIVVSLRYFFLPINIYICNSFRLLRDHSYA